MEQDRRCCVEGRMGLGIRLLAGFILLVLWSTPASAEAAFCPNEDLRVGASADLPDCRAYELVSPPDSNGRLLWGVSGFDYEAARDLFPTELMSPMLDSVVFEGYTGPLPGVPEPNGNFDIYEAQRSGDGWRTLRRLSPSGSQSVLPTAGGVSSDHRYAFTHPIVIDGGARPAGSLAGGAGADYLSNPDGSFELTGIGSLGEEPLAQGRYISPGGKHVIFSTGQNEGQSDWCKNQSSKCKVLQLEPNAAPTGTGTIYDREADGQTHVVSLLPPNQPQEKGQEAFYQGASKDGTTIAFKIAGTLYVRVKSGEPGAETLKAAEGDPVYAGLSDDGRYLFYVAGGEKGTIHRFDTTTGIPVPVNPTAPGEVVNVSADGSHVYFISEDQIGVLGEPGEPNLYDWDVDGIELVATVVDSDLVGIPALTRWTKYAVIPIVGGIERGPGADSSRATPDGKFLVFESKAKLTDYENAGHTEIYRYDDAANKVNCVSCNSNAIAASSDARLQELKRVRAAMVIHNLSADGSRVFFETAEPLTATDIDATNDIYQWREEGLGSEVNLISSGQSTEYPPLSSLPNLPLPNLLFSATPDGSDVVFLSQDNLTGEAGIGGVPALYDARINGGFPTAPTRTPCVEEGCRRGAAGVSIPFFAVPRSEKTQGNGDVKPRRHRCHHPHKGVSARKGRLCSKKRSNGSRGGRVSSVNTSPNPAGQVRANSSPSRQSDSTAESSAPSAATIPAAAVSEEFSEFGIDSVRASLSTAAAGQSLDLTTLLKLNYHIAGSLPQSDARVNGVSISLPPGLVGNPTLVPKCSTGEFIAFANCPPESQVGVTKVLASGIGTGLPLIEPVYNLVPPHPEKEIARFGFEAVRYLVFIDVKVRTASDYGVTASVHSAPGLAALLEAETTLWGDPTNPIHDPQRLTAKEALNCSDTGTACEAKDPDGERPVPRTGLAFMTNPSACQGGTVGFSATSYQLPGLMATASAPLPEITNCQGLPFNPNFSADPTSHKAGAPTGLNTTLILPQHLGAEEPATATMREARVTLPEGMQVNPAAANWIEACSAAQVGYHEEVDANCPDGSKLGTATIKSPALPEPIEGNLYQRTPEPGHQLGLWLAVDALGLHVKLPGELVPDKSTGRLTAVFSDLPQVPVEEIDLNVWGGARAPLINPSSCGTYTTNFSFAPHSQDPAKAGSAPMQISEGCNAPFDPKLKAGTTKPKAGKFSSLIVDLTREDGDQALRGFELKLPNGLLAKIKGVGRCSAQQADAASCPASSKIGTVVASAGAGPDPLWIPQPGKPAPGVFLGGPYKGSPLSIITIVPAQAGPFDLGNLVVRSGLGLDPDTNRPVIKADPLPQFFEGVGLSYRKLHVVVNRPKFALNPTDCSVQKVNSTVTSTQGTVAHPHTRFKVTGCKRLGFKPKLSLSLKGGTKRSDYPALTAVLKARKGDANIARAQVSLPHSEFLAQEHIATICTRKQFAADKCPKGSVYGTARAWTPLLAKPLSGPVYLRSSSHPLPDLVAALHGELDVNLVGRIDSHNGGIRTTFERVPDAPVTKFVLKMRGGEKGLLVNSADVCAHSGRAQANFTAQNGRAAALRPRLEFRGCSGGRGKGSKR
jgi:hypothetical protein